MRFGRRAGLLLAVIPFLAGCSGFWDAPSSSGSSGGCTTNCTTATSGAFYILTNGTTPQIAGNSIVSGKLNTISGSPWTLTSTPYSMALSPNGAFLYVSSTAGVSDYPIANGALGAPVQVSQDDSALAIAIDSTGNWLIEALQGAGAVTMAAIPLNASTGGPSGIEVSTSYTVSNAAIQSKLALSPDNTNIFVPLGTGGVVMVPFNAAAASGQSPFSASAKLIPVANSGGAALSVAVDPAGRLFYIGETLANSGGTSGGLLAYDYSTLSGTLKQVSGSPIASGGLAPNAILPNPAGSYVYVANGQGTGKSGTIDSFSISASGAVYTVASGSSIATGTQPLALAEDSSSQFLFAVSGLGNPYFNAYTFDATTAGKLDSQIVASTGSSPVTIVAAP